MKILKESFVEDTPKVYVKQLPEETECIFEFMSVASLASTLLSELGKPISEIEPVSYLDSTHYKVKVENNSDVSLVKNLLMSYGFLVI